MKKCFFGFKQVCLIGISFFILTVSLTAMNPQDVVDDWVEEKVNLNECGVSSQGASVTTSQSAQGYSLTGALETTKNALVGIVSAACFVKETVAGFSQKLQGPVPVASNILHAPWSQKTAEDFCKAHDYEALAEYLYAQIDGQKAPAVIDWVGKQAAQGVIPCCYFDIRNRIHMLDGAGVLAPEAVMILARDILIFLMLIELDIITYYVVYGEVYNGEIELLQGVYQLFKQRIYKLLEQHIKTFSHSFKEVVKGASAWFDDKMGNGALVYRPCVWIPQCYLANQEKSSLRTRIFYGQIPPTRLKACCAAARQAEVKSWQGDFLYTYVLHGLNPIVQNQQTFAQFLSGSCEFDQSWFMMRPQKD